jgi:hypothetical protein
METLRQFTEALGALFATVSLPLLMIFFCYLLWRADRSHSTFRIIHFLTDGYGRGDKYSLGYVLIMVVGTWGLWRLIENNNLTEWYWTALLAAFVIGAVAGTTARLTALVRGAKPPPPDSGDTQPEEEGVESATIGKAPKR